MCLNIKNYEKLLNLKVFTVEDIYNFMGNISSAKTLIRTMLAKKYIKRIKHNLYTVCDIEFKKSLVNSYEIASKIKEDAYISYYSAYAYHKNKELNTVYVSTEKRFENFEFEGCYYKYIESKNNLGIIQDGKIKVTDEERTIIDCINKTELVGGNKKLLKCLESFIYLDNEKILKYLAKYNSKKLYVKVGALLDIFKEQYGIDSYTIEECKKQIGKNKLHFNEETKRMKSKYLKDWNLIVPKIFLYE